MFIPRAEGGAFGGGDGAGPPREIDADYTAFVGLIMEKADAGQLEADPGPRGGYSGESPSMYCLNDDSHPKWNTLVKERSVPTGIVLRLR